MSKEGYVRVGWKEEGRQGRCYGVDWGGHVFLASCNTNVP